MGRRHRAPAHPGRARAGRARRLASASSTCGRSSTTSSRSTATRRRPRCSSPPCSQRTKHIRLGHGIILTAPQFNHPARTAERVAMLDLVSERPGRVRHGRVVERGRARPASASTRCSKREQWLEGLEVAVRCMAETPFTGVDGKYVQMPPRNVVPKPVQKPHPPLWVACSRRDTILLAAEKGIGALTFAFIDPEEARQLGRRVRAHADREVRAGRLRGQPAGGLRQPDDAAPRRGRGDPPRRRGRQLLRLLARPLLRVRRAPARRDRRVGASTSSGAPRRATTPRRSAAGGQGGAARRQGRRPATPPGCAARSARPTRCASTCAATRRPASTR